MRALMAALAVFAVFAGSALGADEPAPAYDWSGGSVGLFGGWQWSSFDQNELSTEAFSGSWWFPPGPNAGNSYDDNDLLFGLQADWNRQDGHIVSGLGFEIGSMSLNVTAADPNAPPIPVPGPAGPVTNLHSDIFGSLTGRVGYATGRWLAYARAGVSLVDADAKTIDACARSFCGQLTINAKGGELLAGLTAGAGLEYGVGERATIGAEYRLYKFEDLKVSGVASNLETYTQNISPDVIHTVRMSVNFKF